MHDALTTRLDQIGAIRVIARRSTMRYAGSTQPLPEIAQELGVDAWWKLYYDWDWDGAEREFRRANELNPSLAMNRYHYAVATPDSRSSCVD